MKLPAFLKEDNEKIIFTGPGELVYYIPDKYFGDSKVPTAAVYGAYIQTMGVFDWALIDTNGKVGKAKPFKYPTMVMCKPSRIEKVTNLSLNGLQAMDYRVLHFVEGDEAISDIHTARNIDNVELLFRTFILVEHKMPTTIPYDKLHEYFPENMNLNAKGYGLNMQMFGLMITELCRDPNNISVPFRLSKNINESMYGYRQISIKTAPKFTSPFMALTSENWDESLMSAITMSQDGNNVISPLERVVTG